MRRPVTAGDLGALVREAFGSDRRLADLSRLAGGSKKGVYRLTLNDGATAVLYLWSEAENYWPAGSGQFAADPFADASGLDLFLAAQQRLAALGVRTPGVTLVDRSHRHLPGELAIVEDIAGESLAAVLERSVPEAEPALRELGAALTVLHADRYDRIGKVALVDVEPRPAGDAPAVVRRRAQRQLAIVSGRVERIRRARDRIGEHLESLAGAVAPRQGYALIHGELGPDHVLVDKAGRPALIDIEGLMFFDVEWEHAFLRLRFGPEYRWLAEPGLDGHRLRFYEFAQSLSLIEGPLRLADTDFPYRDAMLGIAEHHIAKVLGAGG
jgi:hypothetical protein